MDETGAGYSYEQRDDDHRQDIVRSLSGRRENLSGAGGAGGPGDSPHDLTPEQQQALEQDRLNEGEPQQPTEPISDDCSAVVTSDPNAVI